MGSSAGWTLAIDLGATRSVGVARAEGRSELVEVDGATALPAGVFLDASGYLLTGAAAQEAGSADPQRFEPSPWARLPEPEIALGGTLVAAEDLVAAVLERIVGAACRARGGPPTQVRLTYPAGWGHRSPKLGALGRAAVEAGAANVRFVPEVVAVAVHLAEVRDLPVGARIAVHDLSAGRLDCAVLENTWWGFVLLGPPGGLEPVLADVAAPSPADLQACAAELAATIERSGLLAHELEGVYLAGQTSEVPEVAAAVAGALGVSPRPVPDPAHAAALGAALADDAVASVVGSTPAAARLAARARVGSMAVRAEQRTPAADGTGHGEVDPEGQLWWRDGGTAVGIVLVALAVLIALVYQVY